MRVVTKVSLAAGLIAASLSLSTIAHADWDRDRDHGRWERERYHHYHHERPVVVRDRPDDFRVLNGSNATHGVQFADLHASCADGVWPTKSDQQRLHLGWCCAQPPSTFAEKRDACLGSCAAGFQDQPS